jgi:hypothetical protein
MIRKKEKYYLVLSKSRNYRMGVYPYTEEGKKQAEEFVKKNKKTEELYIVEK